MPKNTEEQVAWIFIRRLIILGHIDSSWIKQTSSALVEFSLKDYNYSTIKRPLPNGKYQKVYFWNVENCGKNFLRRGNLLDHFRMHEGVRPFSCQKWGKTFTQKSNFKRHMKMHSQPNLEGRKRFCWNLWGSTYTERYNFKVSWQSQDWVNHSILGEFDMSFTIVLTRIKFHSYESLLRIKASIKEIKNFGLC